MAQRNAQLAGKTTNDRSSTYKIVRAMWCARRSAQWRRLRTRSRIRGRRLGGRADRLKSRGFCIDSVIGRWYVNWTCSTRRSRNLAVHPSVIKRHRQSLKRRARNVEVKSRLRTLIKKARQAVESKNSEASSTQIRAVDKALGKAVSKGILKKNTASRWLSRLSRSAARQTSANT